MVPPCPFMDFSVCVLLYGDHASLAARCLNSIASGTVRRVRDYRVGLNAVSAETRNFAYAWAEERRKAGIPVYIFETPINRYKYPIMRRMLYTEPPIPKPADLIMWFDDDSYLTNEDPDWIDKVYEVASTHDVVGQYGWEMPMQGRQWNWIMSQMWFNETVGPPQPGKSNRPAFRFVQGAWWVARRAFLAAHNYPWPELRHNGGDSMLGEMCRHVGAKMARFDEGVRINADADGNHSKATRRGDTTDERIGAKYDGTPLDTSHQQFLIQITQFLPEPQDAHSN